jgi:hypothetical protein
VYYPLLQCENFATPQQPFSQNVPGKRKVDWHGPIKRKIVGSSEKYWMQCPLLGGTNHITLKSPDNSRGVNDSIHLKTPLCHYFPKNSDIVGHMETDPKYVTF